MEFLKSPHAKVWPLAAVAAGTLALAALEVIDDAPLGSATQGAATMSQWQAQFAHGLQVSLRAVADGHDRPAAPRAAEAAPASAASHRLQPAVAEPAFTAKAR